MPFDFSDHIVLCVVQYMLPTLLEMNYLLYYKLLHNLPSTTTATPKSVFSFSSFTISINYRSIYFLPFLLQFLFLLINCRVIFFTTLFFHTPIENIVGFLIACLFSFLPLLSTKPLTAWLSLTH
jgi:hypothetical protein